MRRPIPLWGPTGDGLNYVVDYTTSTTIRTGRLEDWRADDHQRTDAGRQFQIGSVFTY
jgi:hypothetical protein